MNKNIFTILGLSTFIVVIIFIASSVITTGTTSVHASSSGSPGNKTNSPGDGGNCTQCHSGTLNPGSANAVISSSGLLNGYTPGQTYTISAAITGTTSSKIGFEVTSEKDIDDAKIGTIIITDATRTKSIVSGTAITHNSSAGSVATSGSNAWSFDWTAPNAGTGSVTFYGAFNATNSSGTVGGDQVYTSSFSVIENIGTGIEQLNSLSTVFIYPNPASNYIQLSSIRGIESIEILNLSGAKVLQERSSLKKIDIEGLTPGVYFVKLKTKNNEAIKKLIIQ
jgi:hypothetical protein